jgi:uncharacterized membrane protein YcaP (DUF421 family)
MQSENLKFFDPHRWLMGNAPNWFVGEVVLRAVLIYLALLFILRMMGKRTAGQMSITELAVVVTLGAAVGVPMQAEERGLLNGFVILIIALIFQRGLAWMATRSRKVETLTQGDVSILIEDGVLKLPEMEKNGIPRERIYSVLRGSGVEHLGQVRRLYIEPSGEFSLYQSNETLPGLSVVPTFDTKLRSEQIQAGKWYACFSCGVTRQCDEPPEEDCPACGCHAWTEAVRQINLVEQERQEEKQRQNDHGRKKTSHHAGAEAASAAGGAA